MLIPFFFFLIGEAKSHLRCPSSSTDEINFPWKQTSKYFHTVFLIPFDSIYSSYLDFPPKGFFPLHIFSGVSASALVN